MIIDLARMRGVTVDPARRVARCNGGALLGELDDAAQAVGLACTAGTVSHTGIAGLTLGGGMGRLQRKLGLSIDCLRAVELVTADGRQVRASADDNPDLFWGMRGAGANFGIVTALEFDLAPVGPEITRGALIYPAERARDVAAVFRDYMPSAPDDLMASIIVGEALPADEYPPEIAGKPIVILSIAYAGPEADADRVLAPFGSLGPAPAGTIGRMTHLESQHANDEAMSWGHRIYTKSGFLNALPDELMDAFVDHVAASPPGEDVFSIWAFGGAIGRVPDGRDGVRRPVRALLGRRGIDVGRPRGRRGAPRLGALGHGPHRSVARDRQLRERRDGVGRRGDRPEHLRRCQVQARRAESAGRRGIAPGPIGAAGARREGESARRPEVQGRPPARERRQGQRRSARAKPRLRPPMRPATPTPCGPRRSTSTATGKSTSPTSCGTTKTRSSTFPRTGTFTCTNGGTGAAGSSWPSMARGTRMPSPANSGWWVAEVDKGECGAESAGLVGCKFDGSGAYTSCGVAVIDGKTDDITVASVSR